MVDILGDVLIGIAFIFQLKCALMVFGYVFQLGHKKLCLVESFLALNWDDKEWSTGYPFNDVSGRMGSYHFVFAFQK